MREQWGDYLPEDLLTPKEFAMYERYYGQPIRMLKEGENPLEELGDIEGEVEEALEAGTVTLEDKDGVGIEIYEEEFEEFEEEGGPNTVSVNVSNPLEAKGYQQLQRDMERAFQKQEQDEEFDEDEVEEQTEGTVGETGYRDDGSHTMRTHPLTSVGRYATFPSTIRVPPSVTEPTTASLADVPNKHLDEAASRLLGGQNLPDSPFSIKKLGKSLKHVFLDVEDSRMGNIASEVWLATVLPGYYSQALSALTELRRRLGGDWVLGHGKEGGVKTVLDVGAGGAGVLAWKSIVEAEQNRQRDEAQEGSSTKEPRLETGPEATSALKATVVTASEPLRYRMSKFLENTTFLPRMPDRNPENVFNSPSLPRVNFEPNQKQPRKVFDLIIATNNLLPLKESHHRKDRVRKLWSHLNPDGGILLIIERGTPHGFEAVAGARSTILRNFISSEGSEYRHIGGNTGLSLDDDPILKEPGSIIAPCTNHEECPMFLGGYTNGVGRKDWCHFSQRYERPTYLQRILGEGRRNHDDLVYSYVAVRRGVDYRSEKQVINPQIDEFKPPTYQGGPTQSPYSTEQLRRYAFTLPRTILPPIKKHGHVIIDVCTPKGKVERWTVPKSYGKVPFRDARKSKWGDLWALGAKTMVSRNIKTGGTGKEPPGRRAKYIYDQEGNVEERVLSIKRPKTGHWSRGSAKLGEKVHKERTRKREIRWARARKEIDEGGGEAL